MNKDDRPRSTPQETKADRKDDSFHDQRDPQLGAGGQPRHWQGKNPGQQGDQQQKPDFDRRGYGRGQQAGLAGQFGREHEKRRDEQTKPDADYDRDSDFGRGDERISNEGDTDRS